MRISLLDRSRTRVGESDADAVATTVERAVRADALGLHRFWTAEHHAVPGIASAAPTVLASMIAAGTRRIRVGTGGVMVPQHRPLVIAEQALLLEALHPGRIDLGLGGSLGFTPPIRRALGRMGITEGEYGAELEQVRDFLAGRGEITARPRVDPPPMYLLAVKGGLATAAQMGLPAVVGGPIVHDTDAIQAYFRSFRPSEQLSTPYLMVNLDVSVSDDPGHARDLLLPEAWAYADSRDVGEFGPLRPVEEVRRLIEVEPSRKKVSTVRSWASAGVAGSPDQVEAALVEVLARTGASEILANVSTYDREHTARTDEFLASLHA
ncbi:MsnO8 family LLM class oxidoreductase [Demequina aestuarii]|uniref:MsnO8 family LLM class oxidoreductase n=1 Tax=Demequina aestuarii TaxID=327095 RepID=UPI000786162D|nr:MsnO8 family LLM class oxidoreductase [Demequina aestuarii]